MSAAADTVTNLGSQGFDRRRLVGFCEHVRENIVDMSQRESRLRALSVLFDARGRSGEESMPLDPQLEDTLKLFFMAPDGAVTAARIYDIVHALKSVQDAVFSDTPFAL
ncbi:hypothetical protein BSKO_09416 [Bryopsis sp. KO-2023]|nr:hypothetical protein BSKO_09416 [Bryopsis sp. KO-2023]